MIGYEKEKKVHINKENRWRIKRKMKNVKHNKNNAEIIWRKKKNDRDDKDNMQDGTGSENK